MEWKGDRKNGNHSKPKIQLSGEGFAMRLQSRDPWNYEEFVFGSLELLFPSTTSVPLTGCFSFNISNSVGYSYTDLKSTFESATPGCGKCHTQNIENVEEKCPPVQSLTQSMTEASRRNSQYLQIFKHCLMYF